MAHTRFFKITVAFCFLLLFINLPFSAGQDIPVSPAAENASESESEYESVEVIEPLTIKLDVNEVRLDVVVLDNRGRPVTDLTAADFEIFQNGVRQNVVSSVYIENQADAAAQPSAARKEARNFPALPSAELKKEDVNRTIVFVLDDMSMNPLNAPHAKMALRNFVEKQMQSGASNV